MTSVPDVAPETLGFLVDSAPDGVAIVAGGIVTFINARGAQLFAAASPAAVVGTSIADYLPAEDARLAAERIAEMFRTGVEQPPSEYRLRADPSRTIEIKSVRCSWQGQPAVVAFARDVTERKAIERKLIETDRLAALGTLAAGVAHEINNPLTYAQLSLQRIERDPAMPDHLREYLRDIEHGIARVASIMQSLRTFPGAASAVTDIPSRPEHSPAPPPGPITAATPRRRVLIVDDQRLVRDTIARVLVGNHDVTAVDSGLAALTAIASATYDVIVCDVMMPGVDGREVHRRIATAHPGVERRIVFITGGTFAPDVDAFLASCGNRCLAKPFGIEQILDVVATAG